jgi:hypothetical protein
MKLRTSPDFQLKRFAIGITIRFSDKKGNVSILLIDVNMSLLLRPYETSLWYAATTINLMGLALMNILTEFRINSDRKENLASNR